MKKGNIPKAARAKARSGIRRNKALGNKCATRVGKIRAQQIANNRPMSQKTLMRTYSYLKRGYAYRDESKPNSCGTISHDMWGGPPMLKHVEKRLGKR
jgi:hypothetical protein